MVPPLLLQRDMAVVRGLDAMKGFDEMEPRTDPSSTVRVLSHGLRSSWDLRLANR